MTNELDKSRSYVGGPLVSCVVAATSYVLHTLTIGKKAQIQKIMYCNRTAGASLLRIGYLTLGAVFTQVLPDIYMVPTIDGELSALDIPLCGNAIDGFKSDTTAVTGTLGNIICQCSVAGAAPADVQVKIEVLEI